jgi:hypothetical protein
MPWPYDRARFENRYGGPNLDKNDGRRANGDRSNGVQHDAQRTVVGIGFQGMYMRYLDDRQQRQQNEAHHRRYRKGSRPGTILRSTSCW